MLIGRNHLKTFYAVNTVYVMKQGTHIQFELVTITMNGLKKKSVMLLKHAC